MKNRAARIAIAIIFLAGFVFYKMCIRDSDYVVIGEGNTYNYENILKAVQLVNKGAKLIGCLLYTSRSRRQRRRDRSHRP